MGRFRGATMYNNVKDSQERLVVGRPNVGRVNDVTVVFYVSVDRPFHVLRGVTIHSGRRVHR